MPRLVNRYVWIKVTESKPILAEIEKQSTANIGLYFSQGTVYQIDAGALGKLELTIGAEQVGDQPYVGLFGLSDTYSNKTTANDWLTTNAGKAFVNDAKSIHLIKISVDISL
jgi:hypothetical protein